MLVTRRVTRSVLATIMGLALLSGCDSVLPDSGPTTAEAGGAMLESVHAFEREANVQDLIVERSGQKDEPCSGQDGRSKRIYEARGTVENRAEDRIAVSFITGTLLAVGYEPTYPKPVAEIYRTRTLTARTKDAVTAITVKLDESLTGIRIQAETECLPTGK